MATASTEIVIPIYSVDNKDKVCAISFDAAWGNEQTDDLLDTLDEYEVKTTFFLVGSWVKKYPESVKKIAEKGHDVGNHSSTHAHMPALSADKMKKEITTTKLLKYLKGELSQSEAAEVEQWSSQSPDNEKTLVSQGSSGKIC